MTGQTESFKTTKESEISENNEKNEIKTSAVTILNAKLKKNKRFNTHFVSMAEDGTIVNFCKLSRNHFKSMLTTRYGAKL